MLPCCKFFQEGLFYMKKHLLLTALVMALVLCFSFGAMAADSGYVNDYKITGLDTAVTDGNVTIMTVGQWRAANDAKDTETFFNGGEALSDDDIVIANKTAAIVLAVGTRNPWGYPSGSVLDAGVVKDGAGVRDTTWSIEFLADWWDSWAPSNCGTVKFDIVKYDFAAKTESEAGQTAVRVTRLYDLEGQYGAKDQNNDKDLTITTYYSAPQEGNYLYMWDCVANNSKTDAVWYNGYAGYTGYQGTGDGYENIAFSVTNKGDDGAATYGKGYAYKTVGSYANTEGKDGYKFNGQYMTSFVVPADKFTSNQGNDFIISGNGGKSGYQELYVINSANDEVEATGNRKMFDPEEAVTFEEYIVVSDKADHAVLNDFIFTQRDEKTYPVAFEGISGAEGTMEVILYKGGKCLGWYTLDAAKGGTIDLPEGEYTYKVEKNGFCTSATADFTVDEQGGKVVPQLGTEKVKVNVKVVDQNGKDIYAKVGVYNGKGVAYANTLYPTVRYCGNSVYQTTGNKVNAISVEIPKGEDSWLKVFGEGYFFTSSPVNYEIKAADAVAGKEFKVTVEKKFASKECWLASDVHHHTNKNDAFALPEDVVNSYLVSGLDVAVTTDHDFTENNYRAYNYIKDNVSEDIIGYIPSVEISCSWAHFNVVPQTVDSWEWFVDPNATNAPVKDENGVGLAFTDLKYFIEKINGKEASVTANHPWYSYGLFTALNKDAVPGGYTDAYGMIGLNGSYRPQEMAKTIVSGMDLWDGYLGEYKTANGTTIIGSKEVDVKSTHYYAGGSDTHDVLTPYATNTAETSDTLWENREEFFTGKVRSIAYVEDLQENELKGNSIAFGQAMVNGNSYTTTGPMLDLDKVPGNDGNGEINIYPVDKDGVFTLKTDITALSGIRDILVLTDEADKTYSAYVGKANQNKLNYRFKRDFKLTHVDKELSIANGIDAAETDPELCAITDKTERTTDYTLDLKYAPETKGLHWVAVCVVDIYGNFAVTNAYWVGNMNFSDVATSAWYYKALLNISSEGLINGYPDGTFGPEGKITRAEFATMIYNYRGGKDAKTEGTPKKFSDVGEDFWGKAAIDYLSAEGILDGYPDGTFCPNKTISRAEMAQIIYNFLGYKELEKSFSDVAPSSWYYNAVTTLHSLGIVNGMTEDKFVPENTATRAQAGQIMYNVLLFD